MISVVTRAVHLGLPVSSKARTSPLSVPTTTVSPDAPTPAEMFLPAWMRHTWRPLVASRRLMLPSMDAT